MKLIKLTFAIALMIMSLGVMAQDKPQPSPAGSASTKVGLTNVEINYYRPQMKGRKIFGEGEGFLQSYGKLWRAGANQGTTIKFSTAVKVGGKDLAAGEYLFLATPGKSDWTVMFYTDPSIGGYLSKMEDSKIAAKFSVKGAKLGDTVETLTYNITDISKDSKSANIQLSWENTSVKVPLSVTF
mgnify:CR=1 FL=1|jgi:hypothetical protein